MSVNYISLDRLSEFLTALKGKYAANTSASAAASYGVNFAQHALMDGEGNTISSYYATAANLTALDGRVTTLDGQAIKTINFTPSGASQATALTPVNGAVAIDLHEYALKSEISAALHFKGIVATQADLPSTDVAVGDVYIVTTDSAGDTNSEFVCVDDDPLTWEKLGPTVDFSGFVTKKTSANGKIATFDSTGDVIGTAVDASILSNGDVTSGNGSFVTGGQVASAIETAVAAIDFPVDDVKIQIGSGTASSIVDSNDNAIIVVDDVVTASSTNLVTSGAVSTAIGALDYSKVVEEDGTTKIATLQEASAADVAALFA